MVKTHGERTSSKRKRLPAKRKAEMTRNEGQLLDFGNVELVVIGFANELVDRATAMVADQLVAHLLAGLRLANDFLLLDLPFRDVNMFARFQIVEFHSLPSLLSFQFQPSSFEPAVTQDDYAGKGDSKQALFSVFFNFFLA